MAATEFFSFSENPLKAEAWRQEDVDEEGRVLKADVVDIVGVCKERKVALVERDGDNKEVLQVHFVFFRHELGTVRPETSLLYG